ncbi:PREDICTED: ankyrin repeat domain-containing protein 30A isoform X2 [Dipodomys ordii]|uniref:Ankyrin repeat domain-containing protein 30A isoform X2 n=1 Tax=Dipodomys ordii TaxID=10020 RepID=A0A1S3GKK2_DIPOR|nr:PREDICTED: ankyrin repeat domain-containing protein 30A isoform X2 [Dipodomys ordii]
MKKIFGFRTKGPVPLGSSGGARPRRSSAGFGSGTAKNPGAPGYSVHDKDMGKIHKAASVGDVAKVQHILLLGKNGLNDRDRRNRTALHFACVFGHSEVVTLLVERKCEIDACDNENSTALIKAVQCQEEECVTILLEHGANPNIPDASGNTALHYAVYNENIQIAAKLFAHDADIEARNKDDLTPLLLALREKKQQIVEFFIRNKAKTCAVDELESKRQVFSDCEEKRLKNSENGHSDDEISEDDSLTRLSNTPPGPGDPWPSSDEDDYDFDNKNAPKVNLKDLWTAAQQSRKNQTRCDFRKVETRTLFDNNNSDNEKEDVVELLPKTSVKVQSFSLPSSLSPDPMEGKTEPAIGKGENDTNIIESASQELVNNDNLTHVDGRHRNNKTEMMSALGLGDEDEDSPWDSESVSESLPLKCAGYLSGDADPRGKNTVNEQVEDMVYIPSCMSGSRNFKMAKLEDSRNVDKRVAPMESLEKYPLLKTTTDMKSPPNKDVGRNTIQTFEIEQNLEITSESEEERLIANENNQLQQVEGKMNLKSKESQLSANVYNIASSATNDDELNQERKSTKTDKQQFPFKDNEKYDGSGTALHMKKVKKMEKEKWTSRESMIMLMCEKSGLGTDGLLYVKDEKDQDEGRPTKNAHNENNKVKNPINEMDDFDDDLTQSSETVSEDYDLPHPTYENIVLLIEQLRMECKDFVSLLKIRDAVHSYKRWIELKKSQCDELSGKIKRMEIRIRGLQKELSEIKEEKSQLEHEKVEWEQELCKLRFALKQEEEKRKSAEQFYEKIKDQLRKSEEQYNKEVEMKQQLEVSVRTLDMELKTVRNNLNQVVEERNDAQRQLSREQNARLLQDGILANHLCKQKEKEMMQKKMNAEVSFSHEKEKDLLHTNHRLQDEIAMVRLEIDTIRSHNQEKEKKYLEDIEIANEKNDNLQKTIKLNEETLTKTVFQYNGQISILTADNAMLNSKLENEKQNRERLETEVELYRTRLAAAINDHGESQTSKKELELAFQRARDEWSRLQDKLNFDICNLKDNNEVLSQQLSKAERKFNSLETELYHTKDALREKTLILEHIQIDLTQTQSQMKEIEHMYQNEQGKVNKYIGKQESIEERLSHLQSENTLLRQQLDGAHHKVDSKEKTLINIQDQFHDIIKKLQAESEKQSLMLEDRNKELINECDHLKERLHQYEDEKAEREVVVRQLQQELADTLKKQSMSEASLEVSSRYRLNLENETQDLRKKLDQIRSQLQETQDQHTEAVRCSEKMQDHVQKLELENSKLKVTLKKQSGKIEELKKTLLNADLSEDKKKQLKRLTELKQSLEDTLDQEKKRSGELEKELTGFKKLFKMTKKKLNDHESGDFSLLEDLKSSQFEMDIPAIMLMQKIDDLTAKLETASSKCLHLDKKNQFLQQELLSMKTIQNKCEKLEKNKKKLEQRIVNLKSHIENNMMENGQVEQYTREIEEKARQDLVDKLKQVNLFLQTQAASQENLEQLRENNNASVRSQMELRIKDLESELSKMKTQDDFNKIEIEKYKQLYLEEFRSRKSLSNKLTKTNERLEEANTKLYVEEQQNRSLLSTLSARPILDCPCVGNLHNTLALNRSFIPTESLVLPTLTSQPSSKSMENYLTKVQQELEKSITRELKEAAAELESGFFRASPLGSTPKSSQNLKSEASQGYIEILKKKYMI